MFRISLPPGLRGELVWAAGNKNSKLSGLRRVLDSIVRNKP
jgi:hypothetical protein